MVIVTLKGRLKVEAVIDTAATAPVISWKLGKQLGLARRRLLVKIIQADSKNLSGGSYIGNSSFRFLGQDPISVTPILTSTLPPLPQLTKWSLDMEVLDIGRRDLILGLSWLEEHRFLVDTIRKQLIRKDGFKVSCRKRKIAQIMVMEGNIEEGDTMLLVDAASHYADYARVFSAEQANRLPPHQK